MGLEHVKESILAEGRAAAEAELAKAREEAKAIRARAEQRAQEARGARQHELELAVAALKRRELALSELEAKKLRLGAQKELLAKVRQQALERLASLPPKTNEEYLTALVRKANVQDARVYAREQDRGLIERLGLKYAGPIQGVGGIIVESADGTTREDLRYEVLLEDAWPEALNDVAAALFGAPKAAAAKPAAKGR